MLHTITITVWLDAKANCSIFNFAIGTNKRKKNCSNINGNLQAKWMYIFSNIRTESENSFSFSKKHQTFEMFNIPSTFALLCSHFSFMNEKRKKKITNVNVKQQHKMCANKVFNTDIAISQYR